MRGYRDTLSPVSMINHTSESRTCGLFFDYSMCTSTCWWWTSMIPMTLKQIIFGQWQPLEILGILQVRTSPLLACVGNTCLQETVLSQKKPRLRPRKPAESWLRRGASHNRFIWRSYQSEHRLIWPVLTSFLFTWKQNDGTEHNLRNKSLLSWCLHMFTLLLSITSLNPWASEPLRTSFT